MTIDLKNMSVKDLEKLKNNVVKALADAETRVKREALKAAKKAAADFGFSLEELSDAPAKKATKAKKKKAAGKKAPAKYRNPADSSQTWSGRGRKPQWIHDAVAAGKDLSDFEIK